MVLVGLFALGMAGCTASAPGTGAPSAGASGAGGAGAGGAGNPTADAEGSRGTPDRPAARVPGRVRGDLPAGVEAVSLLGEALGPLVLPADERARAEERLEAGDSR